LKGLTSLDLSSNNIQDISFLSDLKGLTSLDLSYNKIKKVPEELFLLSLNITLDQFGSGLNLYGNPIEEPPLEILKEGKEAVISYFRSLRQSEVKLLNEVKVLIVGEGMAGKTSVLKQLKGEEFNKNESQTHGINIETIQLPEFKRLENEELKDIKAHFWDFGGQEVMHASHRFFLSQRSIYLLVLDSRTDNKKDYWLKHISSFGGNAPTIVVINKIDDNAQYDVERKSLNIKYPFIENRFHKISCVTGLNIQDLKNSITETLPKTKLFGTPISINWLNTKDELITETKANRYINKLSFEKICKNNHVTDLIEQKTLLHFLHDLGIILHFDNLNLDDVFVLDPHWVTVGVYRIINSNRIDKGVLKTSELDFILNDEEIKKTEYDPNKSKKFTYNAHERNYIVHVMKEFELCYELNTNELLIPDLLPKEPDFETNFKEDDVLRFNFKYEFLHPSVISRLIIKLKNDIPEKKLWRFGMQLKNETSEAFVKADLDEKTISICVFGDQLNRRNYFSVLRHALKEINNSFENLEVAEFIPLPGFPLNSVSYTNLLNHERTGRDFYYAGELNKEFHVKHLLDGVINEKQRNKDYKKMKNEVDERGVHIHFSDFGKSTVHVDTKSESSSEAKAKSKSEVTNTISIEIQNFFGETKMLKEDIQDELEIEGVPEKEIKLAIRDIEKAENAIKEIEQAQKENLEPEIGTKNRLTRFINDLGDESSTINKTLKMLRKGKDYGVQLAEIYNKIAQNTGMPSVPPLVLDVIKKI
jgi:small GTP-binding protein